MSGEIRKLAEFLDIPVNEDRWGEILHHCSFDYMKENATKSVSLGGVAWEGGARTFIHKGVNGRWKDLLSNDEVELYESRALDELGEECAARLAGKPD